MGPNIVQRSQKFLKLFFSKDIRPLLNGSHNRWVRGSTEPPHDLPDEFRFPLGESEFRYAKRHGEGSGRVEGLQDQDHMIL